MSFIKILVPLTGGAGDPVVLASAFSAASPFAGHVSALFVRPDLSQAMPFYGEGISPAVMQEVLDAAEEAANKASADARNALSVAAAGAGAAILNNIEKSTALSASFRETEGNFADCVARAARLSDLIVFSATHDAERPGLSEAFEAALIETGRPVLLSAQAVPANFFNKIAVGWNDSVASAHAVIAALPLLKRAKEVEILTVKRNSAEAVPTGELKEYLRLHGVAAVDRVVDGGERPVGEALLDAASQDGAGLLVLGGYGHSRLRELFVTGVTRHVVSHADLPLFLVH